MSGDSSFPSSARLLKGADFRRVFAEGRRLAHPLVQLHVAAHPGAARLGLAVSRRCDKRAVVRNRIKRVLRERFRAQRHDLDGRDLVAVARHGAAGATRIELAQAFDQLLQRARALKLSPPDGTMPAADAEPARHASPPQT